MSNIPWYLDALKQGIEAAEKMNIHPDLKQAAMDQSMRPEGYDSPITRWSQLTTDQLFDLHKGIHDRAVKDTVDKVLEILDTAHFDLDDSALERDVYMRVSEYRKWMKKAVKELKSERPDGND